MRVTSRIVVVTVVLAFVPIMLSGCASPPAEGSAGPEPSAPSEQSLEARLANGATRYTTLVAANGRLSFRGHAPAIVLGRRMLGVFTRADLDDVPGGERLNGKDNVLQVLYERDLTITEKRWNPTVVSTQEQYAQPLLESPRADEYMRSARYGDLTVWYHDPVALEETITSDGVLLPGVFIENAEVWWYVDGVSYMIGAPDATAGELLGFAESMLQ